MRRITMIVGLAFAAIAVWRCDKTKDLNPTTQGLVTTLDQELQPLSVDPIAWTDDELQFLDELSSKRIIGLGEATHGTSEFFEAKHRILKYMVEHHGFRVFAIEADFAESVFINNAVMSSNKAQIEALMKGVMHFWTWKTDEVRDMLYWMCDYNVGKADHEKVQYWGIDCQSTRDHTDLVKSTLIEATVPFLSYATTTLNQIKSSSVNRFNGFSQTNFDGYFEMITSLRDSLIKYETLITNATSAKEYGLTLRLIEVVGQSSIVIFKGEKQDFSVNFRDMYMADNTSWLLDHIDNSKVVLWAHNFHVSNMNTAGATGYYLKTDFPDDYSTIGFFFSKGHFTARTQSGNQFLGLATQSLETDPIPGSLNDVMYRVRSDAFAVTVAALATHPEWVNAFSGDIRAFQIGAVYNNNPASYYGTFKAEYFDRVIYIERTTAAPQLK